MNPRIKILDQLRGLSIIGIVFYHFILELSQFAVRPRPSNIQENVVSWFLLPWHYKSSIIINILSAISSFGWQYVGVFLLLSGFGLTYSRLGNDNNNINFFFKRLKRLVPLWQIAIIFAFFINFISLTYLKPNLISIPTLSLNYYFRVLLFPIVVDYNLLYLPAVNPSLWFITLIFQFYVVFDGLLYLIKRLGAKKFFLLMLVLTIIYRFIIVYFFNAEPISEYGSYGRTTFFFNTLPARLFEFALGMTVAYLIYYKKLDLVKNVTFKIFLAGLVSWIAGNYCTWSIAGWVVSDLLLTAGLTTISLYGIKLLRDGSIASILSTLGDRSFLIYLFHNQPITQLLIPFIFIMTKMYGNFIIFYLLSFFIISFFLWLSTKTRTSS